MSHSHFLLAWRIMVIALSLVASVWALCGQVQFFSDVPLLDFGIYRAAAERYLAGELIYSTVEPLSHTYRPSAIVYKMTPLYLIPFIAMDLLGVSQQPRWFLLAIFVVALILLVLGFYIICRKLNVNRRYLLWPALAIVLWWQPAHWSFYWSSAELWLVVLAIWAIVLMPSYPLISGGIIAVASMLKLYPVLLLLLPLCLGYWRVFKGFAAVALMLAVLCLVIFPWRDISFYLCKVLPILLREPVLETLILPWRFHFGNFQWVIGVERLWWGLSVNTLVFKAVAAAVLLISALAVFTRRELLCSEPRGLVLASCLIHSAILIYLPNVFFGYFCWLILPSLYFLLLEKSAYWLKAILVPLIILLLLPEYWFSALVERALQKTPQAQLGQLVEQAGLLQAVFEFEPLLLSAVALNKVIFWLPWLFWGLCLLRINQLKRLAR